MNNKGVTLIELLIVIVVIGIIATFAVPAVGDIITNSEKDAVVQDARALADQARLYCGQGLCTSTAGVDASDGLTWKELNDMGGMDVFDDTKYVETDLTSTDAILLQDTNGVWEVRLTGDGTNPYNYGHNGADPKVKDYQDPVTVGDAGVWE